MEPRTSPITDSEAGMHRLAAALRERVKELECLYAVSRMLQQPFAGLDAIVQGIVQALPQGFQYPEAASARIGLGRSRWHGAGFRESPLALRVEVPGSEPGFIEISYPAELAVRDPEPFFPEERRLLEEVAAELAAVAERHRSGEEKGRLEAQLRHADRLATIGQLAAGVAHELNEPLTTILGFAQLAVKARGVPKPVADDLARIVEATLQARDVVQKLLTFGRSAPQKVEGCDLSKAVSGVLAFLEPRCRREKIDIQSRISESGLTVRADPTQLNQVLMNLSINAIQAMPTGGTLTLRTARDGEWALLTVEDTGIGMAASVLERVFDPFFTTKGVGSGTGLGLAVVHGIVTSHGGTIGVTSEPGQGSRFEVRLPLDTGGAA